MGARLFAGLHIHAVHDWFQTGYLTITAEERLGGKVLYRLGYPNREVRQSLNDHLLRHLVQDTAQQTANSIRLARLLEAHDCAGLKTLFHAFFASIPYQWYTNNHIADAQPDAEQVLLASRALSMQVDEDGMVVLRGRLPPEVGALLLRAVEAAMQQVPASAEGGEPTTAQRRADALGLVAESALAGGLDPGNPADRFQVTVQVQADALPAREPAEAGPRVAAETREVSLSPSEPVAQTANLVVEQATIATPHVAAETFEVSEAAGERAALETDLDAGQAVIEQAGGLHLGREAARRVACDAGLVVLHHGAGGEVLDVGRRTRTVPSAMRRALLSRDRGQCQFPGCESRHCDAHHVEHWADGGETRLQNLVLACRFHHRALHEGGFRVVPADTAGQFRFLRPDGTPLPAEPPAAGWEGAPLAPTDARLTAAGIGIGPHTATPEWYGESLDLTAALDVLWEPPAASWNALQDRPTRHTCATAC